MSRSEKQIPFGIKNKGRQTRKDRRKRHRESIPLWLRGVGEGKEPLAMPEVPKGRRAAATFIFPL